MEISLGGPYLLVQTVCQHPVLLLGVKQETLYVEVNSVFLIGGSGIRADPYTALYIGVT